MHLLRTPWRTSGLAGILFVVLSFVASAINVDPPPYNQEKLALVTWFAENSEVYRIGHVLAGVTFLLFYFPFFAGFCERLREAEGTPAIWSRVVWAGAIMSPATGTLAGAFIMGGALLDGEVSTELSHFALAANFYAYVVSGAMTGIVMIGSGFVIISTGIFSRWLGWAGELIGIAAIIGLAAVVENNPTDLFAAINGFAWLFYFLWIVVLSIELIRIPYVPSGS